MVSIREEHGDPILSYRSFANVVGIVAMLVSAVVIVTGIAAGSFLLYDGRVLPAVLAFLLSAAFTVVIAMLVPPTRVVLHEGNAPALLITQQSNFGFPIVTWKIETPDRRVIARVRRSAWSRLGRNRWEILSAADDRPIGVAAEESLSRAMLRKFAGKFSRRYESNIRIRYLGKNAGWIARRPDAGGDVDVLDLAGDIDRRIAVAVATLILGSEP